MSTTPILPALEILKAQAKRLRQSLTAEGNFITHSEALELLAHQHGYRDWNTLHAAAGNRPAAPLTLGATITGLYLGQAFKGEIIALAQLNHGSHYRLTIDFDEPVDVVTFDSFSAFRKRVNCTVDSDGRSPAMTSNGEPQMVIAM
ncbi:glyoxalase superfamily protein [uncultured Maricaulis sp.]|uniref:glyoxalase superfamily protein n=1 Tax=uncultured Maricaulis sp. TaxID=174710 RepID=UPI0030DDDC52|tara:strand:- start:19990 stop:20427 length:438 start_codon:yes stop_codon:yes gene_type:complete